MKNRIRVYKLNPEMVTGPNFRIQHYGKTEFEFEILL